SGFGSSPTSFGAAEVQPFVGHSSRAARDCALGSMTSMTSMTTMTHTANAIADATMMRISDSCAAGPEEPALHIQRSDAQRRHVGLGPRRPRMRGHQSLPRVEREEHILVC